MNQLGKNSVSGELLRSYVERIEKLDADKESIADDRKAVFADAKANGFIPSGLRNVLSLRKLKPSDRAEAETLRDMYLHALGMDSEPPLFKHVGLMSVDVTAKDQVIEAMKKFVPANGSITIEAGGVPVRLTRDKDGNVAVTEVVEKPMSAPEPGTPRQARPKPDLPEVDASGAEALGRQAFRDDIAIIQNPFPFGDERRARWDKGWREESGSDGMDD